MKKNYALRNLYVVKKDNHYFICTRAKIKENCYKEIFTGEEIYSESKLVDCLSRYYIFDFEMINDYGHMKFKKFMKLQLNQKKSLEELKIKYEEINKEATKKRNLAMRTV